MKVLPRFLLAAALAATVTSRALADVSAASLFQDHAVLQHGKPVPVWGTADEGENVTVSIAGQRVSTVTKGGRWKVLLNALPPGGPHELVIEGKNRLKFRDVLIGDVWVCSGQSNMERQLGLREGQKPIRNWEAETAGADYPQIRHFGSAQTISVTPQSAIKGKWVVCTPETAQDFTAVGFFFGRSLHESQKIPIGLIHSSWGGTPAEAWTSLDALERIPETQETVGLMRQLAADPAAGEAAYRQRLNAWFATNDAGSNATAPWRADVVDTGKWRAMTLPSYWEKAGMSGLDALVWFRREFELPADWADAPVELHLGAIDDSDTTWVNGTEVGSTTGWSELRVYRIPPGVLKPGRNTLAVRVVDTGGNGGIWGPAHAMRVVRANDSAGAISLAGEWKYQVSLDFKGRSRPPTYLAGSPNAPSVLFNGMIAPLVPYAMRGVIWYQGETNASDPTLYRKLLPNLVADWRQRWDQGDFPFLYVQIAPFRTMPPEIREAQLLSLSKIPNSAMAVTIDVGDANDIHPVDKRPVGERLAVAARALAYGEQIEYSGPLYKSMRVEGNRVVLTFTHVGKGLVAPGGELQGFVIAGADKQFRPARAVIVGDTIEVTAEGLQTPAAVRYAWANVPEGNLFNKNGLPASPFRTDVE